MQYKDDNPANFKRLNGTRSRSQSEGEATAALLVLKVLIAWASTIHLAGGFSCAQDHSENECRS